MKITTVAFLVTRDAVWLALKKLGPGKGRLNGPGGKVKKNETILAGAAREVREEFKVNVLPEDLTPVAVIDFFREEEHVFECHFFLASRWIGTPTETEEMGSPRLYSRTDPLLQEMLKGDALWFPAIIKGISIPAGSFVRYNEDMTEVLDHHISLKKDRN